MWCNNFLPEELESMFLVCHFVQLKYLTEKKYKMIRMKNREFNFSPFAMHVLLHLCEWLLLIAESSGVEKPAFSAQNHTFYWQNREGKGCKKNICLNRMGTDFLDFKHQMKFCYVYFHAIDLLHYILKVFIIQHSSYILLL